MKWKNIPDGYEFRVYLSQGRDDIVSIETVTCPLDGEFDRLYQIMRYLPDAIRKNDNGCTEDVAQYIEGKTGISQSIIMPLIDPLVQGDVHYDGKIAQISYIDVFRYEDGCVQKFFIEGF